MNKVLHWLYGLSVKTKLSITIFLVVTFFGILVLSINAYIHKVQANKTIINMIDFNIKSNENFIIKALLANDSWTIYRYLRSLTYNGLIKDIGFVNSEGIVIAHTDTSHYRIGDHFHVNKNSDFYRIVLQDESIALGFFVIHINKNYVEQLFALPWFFHLMLFVLAAIFSIILGLMITNRITQRLRVLESNVQALTNKDWQKIKIPQWREQDEITALVENVAKLIKKIQALLAHEEELKEFYHKILETLDMFVVIMDEKREIIYYNNHLLQNWALHKDKKVFIDELNEKLSECISHNESELPCTSSVHQQNKNKTILIKSRKIGEYAVITFEDVTKMQQAEKHLGITRSLSLLGEFSAQFTHEIKNLLQPIKLLLGDVNRCDKDDLQFIAKMITKIDAEILQYLKLGSPAELSISTTVDCKSAIEKSLFVLAMRFEEKSLHIEKNIQEDATVFLPKNNFESLLLDLLSNAIEASYFEGDILIDAHLDMQNLTCIRIEDHGSGIAPELQEKIFDPFFTTKERGNGFGLFNVYKTVYQYGGFIELKSEPGFTRFNVYLPTQETK